MKNRPMRLRGAVPGVGSGALYFGPDLPDFLTDLRRACAPTGPGPKGIQTMFTSDDKDDQREAAKKCRECPFTTACDQWANKNDEKHYVWGGRTRGGQKPRVSKTAPPPPAGTPDDELIANALPGNGHYFRKLSDDQKRVVIRAALERGYSFAVMAQKLKTPLLVLRSLHEQAEVPDLDEQVRELYEADRNDHEIAAELVVPKQVVARIRKRLGLPAKWCGQGRRRTTPSNSVAGKAEMAQLRIRVRELHRRGLGDSAIAEELSEPKSRIHYVRTSLGLPRHHGPGRPRRTGVAA